ncbi:hypothetical protein OIU85_029847 [Salix viminalis]|uniref:Uncharacterized protein n=1 Tax=Salix viminalis TaxID=40686 RepID=A0A9Q0QCP6_SALVM|nr:hypothetical protein OIU85_029847 [Salix viminalis]
MEDGRWRAANDVCKVLDTEFMVLDAIGPTCNTIHRMERESRREEGDQAEYCVRAAKKLKFIQAYKCALLAV